MRRLTSRSFTALALLTAAATARAQEVLLHPVHGDHAVVQRDRPIVVVGTAPAGEAVEVSLGSATARAVADAAGRFRATLPAQPASSTGRDLVARCGDAQARARDVLVGEVWICSGQSNMVMKVRSSSTPAVFAQDADAPTLRMFTAPTQAAATPQESLRGQWAVCTPEAVLDFSACGYHFGRALHDRLDVPIGLINVSWGGSSVQAWIRREVLEQQPSAAATLASYERYRTAADLPLAAWAGDAVDDRSWPTGTLPARFEDLGHDIDGTIAFRRQVEIPAGWAGRALTVSLGAIDDRDVTCFGGARIGATNRHDRPRSYAVPARLVRGGTTTVAVQVTDTGGPGGFTADSDALWIAPADSPDDRRSLAGEWRLQVLGTEPPAPTQHWPAHLYNAMLHPVRHTAPRGVIWYQGESNARSPGGEEYFDLFPAMIRDWRRQLGDDELPFLFVQLPIFGGDGPDSVWRFPVIRQAQWHALRTVPRTGMAVTLEVGEPGDIHPKNKHDVGRRLARWALADVYGMSDLVKSGPIAAAATFDAGAVTIVFDVFGAALATRDGAAPRTFEVAGADGVFHPAEAAILDATTVKVTSPQVRQARQVRYAWSNSPVAANLIGGDGLPAAPLQFAR